MNNGAIIQVRDLKKIYRVGDVDIHALRGVTLTIERGEFVCVVGPSGSGKSTLFHILGGLAPATSGTVVIGGRDLSRISDSERTEMRRRMVGFVFQKYNLLPTLSAADNIAIARFLGENHGAEDPKFRGVLEILGIAHRLKHKPRALSGGEQQRVAIARAIVNNPEILLADEPTGNLDSKNSQAVLGVLRDLNERLGQTILMITHDVNVAAYGHRVVHMLDGQIVETADASAEA